MRERQSGFTLIEIVMVLVLLGILASVAVPKYFDLTAKAEENAAKAVAAEYQSRVSAIFAKNLLAGDSCTTAVGKVDTVAEVMPAADAPDWTITLGSDDDAGKLVVKKTANAASDGVKVPLSMPKCE